MKLPISEIKLNPDNPRTIKDDAFNKLVKSIKEFPMMADIREVVLNEDKMILGGNMRFQAMREAGWKEIPIKIFTKEMADNNNRLTGLNKSYEDYCAEIVIKDNISGGEWDLELLANNYDLYVLDEWGLDLDFPEEDEEVYSKKIKAPKYEPSRDEPPSIDELVDTNKTSELLKEISEANISEELKDFLKYASSRHLVFDYSKIAEYYAHADKEVQELFEKSALVIIDFNNAVENGFVELTKYIMDIQEEDYNE